MLASSTCVSKPRGRVHSPADRGRAVFHAQAGHVLSIRRPRVRFPPGGGLLPLQGPRISSAPPLYRENFTCAVSSSFASSPSPLTRQSGTPRTPPPPWPSRPPTRPAPGTARL